MKELAFTEKLALKIIQVGVKRTNYKILEMAPTDVKNIMKETGLTKVPVNKRLNELEKVGLIERKRWTGEICLTDFGKKFMKTMEPVEKIVASRLQEMIESLTI